jgi:hypothetical protein
VNIDYIKIANLVIDSYDFGTGDNVSNIGTIESIPGSTQITFPLPAGTNICLGWGGDIKEDRLIYCIYNSNNKHCILEYNILTNVIDRILYEESILNFNPLYPVYDVNIISGLLLFNDRFNPPRKINIEKAKSYASKQGIQTNLFVSNGVDLDIIQSDTYDFVMSTIALQHICVHEIRYKIMEDIYRVLKSGGMFTAQMGYGSPSPMTVGY